MKKPIQQIFFPFLLISFFCSCLFFFKFKANLLNFLDSKKYQNEKKKNSIYNRIGHKYACYKHKKNFKEKNRKRSMNIV